MSKKYMSKNNDNGKIRIDRGIPVPRNQSGNHKYPWRDMAVGDSFFTKVKQTSIGNSRHLMQQKTGFKFVTRTENGGTRVWRVK